MRLLVASVALALVASASAQLVCARVEPSENANTSATTKCTPLVPALLPDDADPAEADALARCACAYARRACDLRDATCEIRGGCAPSPSEDLACLVPLCELCDDVPVPEGAPRERLCRLCRREMDRGLVAARVDPLWSTWTYGWYSTWLVFLAVDRPWWPPPSRGGRRPVSRIRPILPAEYQPHLPTRGARSDWYVRPRGTLVVAVHLLAVRTTRYRLPDRPRRGVSAPAPSSPPPPPEPAASQLCTSAGFTAELQNVAGTLLPCLAGASAACCAAVAHAVGPSPSATLPDCLCNPQAFETIQMLMLQAADVDVTALLVRCDDAHDVSRRVPGRRGESVRREGRETERRSTVRGWRRARRRSTSIRATKDERHVSAGTSRVFGRRREIIRWISQLGEERAVSRTSRPARFAD